jgi:hypothetical protein
MHLIGLTGPHGSSTECGTEIVARRLVEKYNFAQLSFADPMHDMLAAMLCLSREQLDRLMLDPDWREKPLWNLGTSPSRLLQTLGNEWGRRTVNPNVWLALLQQRLAFIQDELSHEYAGVVIADVRFDNEARFLRQHGTLVHVMWPEFTAATTATDTPTLSALPNDRILINRDSVDLHRQLDHMMLNVREPRIAYLPYWRTQRRVQRAR